MAHPDRTLTDPEPPRAHNRRVRTGIGPRLVRCLSQDLVLPAPGQESPCIPVDPRDFSTAPAGRCGLDLVRHWSVRGSPDATGP